MVMTTTGDRAIWLKERSALSALDAATLAALSEHLELRRVSPHQEVVIADTPPEGLYILATGRLEHKPGASQPMSFFAGFGAQSAIAPFRGTGRKKTIVSLSECRFWFISADQFQALKADYPEIIQVFSQQIAAELRQVASQLTYEQERQDILRPYLVTKARRGVIGRSRYAKRLRQQIRDAFKNCQDDCGSVLVFGEPGTEKRQHRRADSLWFRFSTAAHHQGRLCAIAGQWGRPVWSRGWQTRTPGGP